MDSDTAPLPQPIEIQVAETVFDAPWQAQAFALAVRLSATGHFKWDEWVRFFSEEIARFPPGPGENANTSYYRQWLDALVRIVDAKGLVASGEVQRRAMTWRAAYLNTPHGHAVELAHADAAPCHPHTPARRGVPIAVSPAGRPNDRQGVRGT